MMCENMSSVTALAGVADSSKSKSLELTTLPLGIIPCEIWLIKAELITRFGLGRHFSLLLQLFRKIDPCHAPPNVEVLEIWLLAFDLLPRSHRFCVGGDVAHIGSVLDTLCPHVGRHATV